MHTPKTLLEAIKYFSDLDVCHEYITSARWPNGVECPRCKSHNLYTLKDRRWKCKECKKEFSVKLGTIFEDSPIGLDKWFAAAWMLVNAKNGVSSYEIARALGVTQKTAWFMDHRLRAAMHVGSFDKKLCGEVEADETFIGGKARNMHPGKRLAKGRGTVGKEIIMGILSRRGEVRVKHIENTDKETLTAEIRTHVRRKSRLYTDALASYSGLNPEYVHQVIDHAECYAKGRIHTNGLENFWSLTKRCLNGTYVSVEPFHLFRYMDEQAFRFNARKTNDGERFKALVKLIQGKRLTYKALIGECAASPD